MFSGIYTLTSMYISEVKKKQYHVTNIVDDTPIKTMDNTTTIKLSTLDKEINFPVYLGNNASVPIGGGIETVEKDAWSASFNDTTCIEQYHHLDRPDTISWINTDEQLIEAIAKYRLDTSKFMCILPMKLGVISRTNPLYYTKVKSLFGTHKFSSYSRNRLIEKCAAKKRLPFTIVIAICGTLCAVGKGIYWINNKHNRY